MQKTRFVLLTGAALALVTIMYAQQRSAETPSWAPKPNELPKYTPPHRPHTKLADVRARHSGQMEWRQLVVDDDHMRGEYIQAAPGSRTPRRFHPDTREWWVILDGQLRFTIEGQEPFIARKGSMVQVPMQTMYSMETVGDQPSLRWEVNVAKAKTLYPQDTPPPQLPGFDFIPVKLNRKPRPYSEGNQPHINLYELAERPEYKGRNFQHRFVHDYRAVANIIYVWEKNLPPLYPKNRGHYHPECAEFWLIMTGQIRYPIEGQGVIIASEGDIVYVPMFTFHAPRFHGDGPSCRLAMNGYTGIAHLYDAESR
jgi:quercetin dioxygenase-like cupin family protein